MTERLISELTRQDYSNTAKIKGEDMRRLEVLAHELEQRRQEIKQLERLVRNIEVNREFDLSFEQLAYLEF